ncbi:MAG: hypothetical protein E7170_01920 [Firmicutes bacterium]|nr:hypothetical protein [Bacillota bacterium]
MNEFLNYVNYKLITAFINNEEMFEKISNFDSMILNKNFLLCLEGYRQVYLEKNMLDKDQLYNFSKLVQYIRENIKVKTTDNTEIINNLIVSINETNDTERFDYLVENFIARFHGHNRLKILLDYKNIRYHVDRLKYSASRDFSYLVFLTHFNDEEFERDKENVILDEYFLLSLNQIISEYGDILDDEKFIERTKIIVSENIKKINEVEDKTLKRIIKKESKYYNKHL